MLGRYAIRGFTHYKEGHGFQPKFQQLRGNGVRYGIIPCDDATLYWFFIWPPSSQEKETLKDGDQQKLKQFVLSKLENVPDHLKVVIEDTDKEEIICSQTRFRSPWDLLFGNISKDNVTVVGDACHPMTPHLGQGGCSALEGGLVLARCLAAALVVQSNHPKGETYNEHEKIRMGLSKFAKKWRWRVFDLSVTALLLGFIQESNWVVMKFLREKIFSAFFPKLSLMKADVDPTQLELLIER